MNTIEQASNLVLRMNEAFEPKAHKIGMFNDIQYGMNKPANKDGSLTKYAILAFIIALKGPIGREKAVEILGKLTSKQYADTKTSLNTTFAALAKNNIVKYNEETKKWSKGESFDDWKKKYKLNFAFKI